MKQVIPELLDAYLQDAGAARLQAIQNFQVLPRKGNAALEQRILEAHELLQKTQGAERDSHFRQFMSFREDLIRMRWEKLHPPIKKKASSRAASWENYREPTDGGSYSQEYLASGDSPSFNLSRDFNRLVS